MLKLFRRGLIGRSYDDEATQKDKKVLPYKARSERSKRENGRITGKSPEGEEELRTVELWIFVVVLGGGWVKLYTTQVGQNFGKIV